MTFPLPVLVIAPLLVLEYIVFVHVLHPLVSIGFCLGKQLLLLLFVLKRLRVSAYTLWYLDGKEYTGERRWDAFRTLRLWQHLSPVQYIFPHRADIAQTVCRRLFVVPHCRTALAPLVWGVGLHGGALQFNQPLHYLLPPPYLWVPLLRDVLMWTGAVTYSYRNGSNGSSTVIQSLLDNGRVLVYAPGAFAIGGGDDDNDVENQTAAANTFPDDEMLQYCIQHSVSLVPVIIRGEEHRYRFLNLLHGKFKLYWFRLFSSTRPPPVTLSFGHAMSCNLYTGADAIDRLRSTLAEMVDNLSATAKGAVAVVPDKGTKST